MSNDTKKPDPIFAHHSVVRERPQKESSATTGCLRCEMSHPQARRCWEHRFDGPLCLLADCTAERWIDPQARYSSSCYCAEHRKGREIAAIDPRFTKDHPASAPPEAKQCDDGNTPKTIAEELVSLGVLPLVPLTPEEKAQDQAEWRARVRASIEQTQRRKERLPNARA